MSSDRSGNDRLTRSSLAITDLTAATLSADVDG